MKPEFFLLQQMSMHPSMQPQDVIKLCYQAAFGAEHLLLDISAAKQYFDTEFFSVIPLDIQLYENISPQICRVSLAAWKHLGLPKEWLFNVFISSTSKKAIRECKKTFAEYIECTNKLVEKNCFGFLISEWQNFMQQYKLGAVHHSDLYRKQENPSYRIVSRDYTKLFEVFQKMTAFLDCSKTCVIAVDDILSAQLKDVVHINYLCVDDFFSEKENSFDRFIEEVVPHLDKKDFSYKTSDQERQIKGSSWLVLEGKYRFHPKLQRYIDIKL